MAMWRRIYCLTMANKPGFARICGLDQTERERASCFIGQTLMELDKNIISWRFFMVPFRQGLLSMSYKKEREEAFVVGICDHCHRSGDRVSVIIFKL